MSERIRFVRVEDLARTLQCSRETVRRMCRNKEIPASKVRTTWRIDIQRALKELGSRAPGGSV